MDKTKKLSLSVIILVLLNIVLLSLLTWPYIRSFISRKPRRLNLTREADMFIEKQFEMSPDQVVKFQKARQSFRISMNKLRDQTLQVRKSLIMSIFDDPVDPLVASQMLDELASCSRLLEEVSYNHLVEILRFSNREQKAQLKTLMVDVFKKSERHSPKDS